MVGMSVTDVSQKAIANLGWTDIKLTHPLFAGDTLYAESEVLDKRESKSRPGAGIVTREDARPEPGRRQGVRIQPHHAHHEAERQRRRAESQLLKERMRHTDPAEEAALLDAIERWLEKEVRPQVHAASSTTTSTRTSSSRR